MVRAGTTKRARALSRRRRLPRAALRLAFAALALPFATTSIARQDALGLSPGFARGANDAGVYLASAPRRGADFVSLEAADLFGAGGGPGMMMGALGGGEDLVVLDAAEPDAPATAVGPFVDRTVKGDLQPIRAPEPYQASAEPPTRPAPDALATLPALGELMRPDRRGVLGVLPQVGDIDRRQPVGAALVAASEPLPDLGPAVGVKVAEAVPQDETVGDEAAYVDLSEQSSDTALTSVPMVLREAGANHDGSTPSVILLSGGRMPETTTPVTETPLTVAALPVSTGATTPDGLVKQVAFSPATDGITQADPLGLRSDLEADGKIETRLGRRVFIPDEQLARSEQCLAEAVYFEARGEPVEGQYAVAQVVMNRVRSGYYPDNVCGVVYQNQHRRNACQFSFACDRIPDRVNNAHAWNVATRIARDVTEGGAWLPEVGGSTHYHATYVRPRWIRDMVKLDKIGRHIFYRVRWHATPEDAA